MPKTEKELREDLGRLDKESREFLEQHNDDWNGECEERWDTYQTEIDKAIKGIERLQRSNRLTDFLGESMGQPHRPDPESDAEGPDGESRFNVDLATIPEEIRGSPRVTTEYHQAFMRWLRFGPDRLLEPERRALQVDQGSLGAFLVAPVKFVQELIKAKDNIVVMRQLGTVHTLPDAESLGAVSIDSDPSDPDWTAELDTGTEDTAMAFGKRALHPHPLAKRIKVSNTLLRKAANAEGIVRQRLAYKQSIAEEKGFMTGSGSEQPLGVFTASADGIPTSRDVSEDNTASNIAADGLINAFYSLKEQYQRAASWLVSRELVKRARKLKDSNNNYLWAPALGMTGGAPATILERPYRQSEYVPTTFTADSYVGAVGDFSFYWIVDALDMQIQRLVELYAATNQTGFITRSETDGMPVLAEAFARIQLASS